MSNAAWALQQAVHATLAADADLIAILGDARIYDDVPQRRTFPYITLAGFTLRDWSTSTEAGAEITFIVNAWSRGAGHKQAHLLADTVRAALHDAPLTIVAHHLVNLRHESSDTHRERDGDTYRVTARFRAVLEPTT
jgi:hypothetical protein